MKLEAHFKDLNNPLVGDKKYGSASDPIKRLCLHANILQFEYKNKKYTFETEVPGKFKKLIYGEK